MQISIAQLAALALAASSAVHGHHLAGNTGVVRRVAGHALMAFAVPALAAPVDAGLDIITRQQSAAASKRQPDDAQDEADDAQDDADDAADDADDAADDAQDDADDAQDDADDDADDADDDADDADDDADDDDDEDDE